MGVDHDAVGAFETRFVSERILSGDADADEREIRRQDLAVGEDDRLRLLFALDRLDADPEEQAGAKGPVRLDVEFGQDRRHGAAHRPDDLDHADFGAELGGGRGDLEPDEARADHHHLEACGDARAQRRRVGDVAERVDPGQVDARNVEPSLASAGRQDQMAVADRPAVRERHPMRRPVDPDRPDAETQVDAAVAVEGLGPERQAVQLHLALQERLGERRPLIRQLPLVGQKDDFAVIAVVAQAGRGLHAGVPGADDDDRGRGHVVLRCWSASLSRLRKSRTCGGAAPRARPGRDRPAPCWPDR